MPLPKFARMLAFIKWHASRFDNLGEREPLADPVGWKRGQRSKSEWLSCKFTEDPVPPLFYPSLTFSILAVPTRWQHDQTFMPPARSEPHGLKCSLTRA